MHCKFIISCLSFYFLTDIQVGIYLPCYDIFRNIMEDFTTRNVPTLTPYVPLVAGSIARSLACVSCYPVELARTRMQVSCVDLYVSCQMPDLSFSPKSSP